MSPWNVHNTLLAWGAGFKQGVRVQAAAGNVDVAPTVLALLGIEGAGEMDGRVLGEAMLDGPDPATAAVETRVHEVAAGSYRAALQLSHVQGRRYVDASWRTAPAS
jgi:arylsulfatase A-like enzyme